MRKLSHIWVTKIDPRVLHVENNFSEVTVFCQCVVVKKGKKLSKLPGELNLPRTSKEKEISHEKWKDLASITLYSDEQYQPFYVDLYADSGQLQVEDNEEEGEKEEDVRTWTVKSLINKFTYK